MSFKSSYITFTVDTKQQMSSLHTFTIKHLNAILWSGLSSNIISAFRYTRHFEDLVEDGHFSGKVKRSRNEVSKELQESVAL